MGLLENLKRDATSKIGDKLTCRCCGLPWERGPNNFHGLCNNCFTIFDKQKMEGRLRALSGELDQDVPESDQTFYDDSDDWIAARKAKEEPIRTTIEAESLEAITLTCGTKPVLVLTPTGMEYLGNKVDDAGEAHGLFVSWLKKAHQRLDDIEIDEDAFAELRRLTDEYEQRLIQIALSLDVGAPHGRRVTFENVRKARITFAEEELEH